jgi:hypothetical protein
VCSSFASAAAAAAALLATSAAAYRTGLLDSMPAKLLPLMQAIHQQCHSPSGYLEPCHGALDIVHTLTCVTEAAHGLARVLVPAALLLKALQCVAQLLQQLPQCGALLPTAAPSTRIGSGRVSSSSSSGRRISSTLECCFRLQIAITRFLHHFTDMRNVTRPQLDDDSAACIQQMLMNHAVQELLLQPLVSYVALLHQHHELEWQQQQQQQQQQRRQQRSGTKDLLSIPAFHQDMLQLLPGGQAYLDAAATVAAAEWGDNEEERLHKCRARANVCILILGAVFNQFKRVSHQRHNSSAPAISAAAVRLTLQLQLLTAGELQRQRQQQQCGMQNETVYMLLCCNYALITQLQAAVQAAGGSCLPPEVLQQAGLQLLQALAAPLQQLQALMAPVQQPPPDQAALQELLDVQGNLELQLYVFIAAAAGMFEEQQVAAGGVAWFVHVSHCIALQLSRASLLQACI